MYHSYHGITGDVSFISTTFPKATGYTRTPTAKSIDLAPTIPYTARKNIGIFFYTTNEYYKNFEKLFPPLQKSQTEQDSLSPPCNAFELPPFSSNNAFDFEKDFPLFWKPQSDSNHEGSRKSKLKGTPRSYPLGRM